MPPVFPPASTPLPICIHSGNGCAGTASLFQRREFASLVGDLWPLRDVPEQGQVTLFEFLTGMAYYCYAQAQADVQTIEVGLGGRLDATNVVDAQVCVITSVSMDHAKILGDTIGEIAADKAGIIKAGLHPGNCAATPGGAGFDS